MSRARQLHLLARKEMARVQPTLMPDDVGVTPGRRLPRGEPSPVDWSFIRLRGMAPWVRPMDIDGVLHNEATGRVLFLEAKRRGGRLKTGPLRTYKHLASLPGVTVLLVQIGQDEMPVAVAQVTPQGIGKLHTCNADTFGVVVQRWWDRGTDKEGR